MGKTHVNKNDPASIICHYTTAMDLAEIRARIQAESDARFGETIEKMLLNLRHYHTHQCWREECYCEYCQFIRGPYTHEKMNLTRLKRKVRDYERNPIFSEYMLDAVYSNVAVQKWNIKKMKKQKKALRGEIL